ncbi:MULTISPECIES: hypothetical protein [unclassified Leifsonia]|uniref:hypothetical protein n=1 Tax=unclassified Leifsonia TaxID=2663824 RepID=UPI0008A7754D|nr:MULTISPECIES: hypothetical protein [unclassified Leifsonia]SEH58350.1 hypothetical protein SAMN04515694_101225 [Leifsonia sp. CL154]SFL20604.1 hypothetical protein SAMN04515692_101254 [Leifsonia sp. CL147]
MKVRLVAVAGALAVLAAALLTPQPRSAADCGRSERLRPVDPAQTFRTGAVTRG